MGNVAENFLRAREYLLEHLDITAFSGLYRTAAWGMEQAPDFLNQVWQVYTHLKPKPLLEVLLETERWLGRKRTKGQGYQNRPIDLDILLYDDLVLDLPGLQIPHPRLCERRFALLPLAELAPHYQHPLRRQTVAQLLDECGDKNRVERC